MYAMKIPKSYRLHPLLVQWLEKTAAELDRDETWVLENCIVMQAQRELPPGFKPGRGAPDENVVEGGRLEH
jgi:hypothetical protein